MNTIVKIFLFLFAFAIIGFLYYLNRPISNAPKPAKFNCLNEKDGVFFDFDSVNHIYGFGLIYQQHIVQTSASYNANDTPPIFKKSLNSILQGNKMIVKMPTIENLRNAMNTIEPGLADLAFNNMPTLKPLVDYEVELGIIILEKINLSDLEDDKFIPKLGFFIANDVSERSIAVLGDGKANKFDYWGVSKDFEGFTPLPQKYWVPNQFNKDQIPCVTIQTFVNGKIRQEEKTNNMVYTPTQLLNYISNKYQTNFEKGDIILTGTPGGTAIHAPRWKIRIGNLIGADRFKKLETIVNGNTSEYLKKGDEVIVKGEWLGEIKIEME
ncbi:MAG: fumarylacetoacetate hydrolase family protein [Bacteroidetes bacterium]|jgi:2-keto-4-pentenoate hydratase/2-oxohepta-3-ene-1,7-dioic acid hydratase in catechol pathway|nr:fumarylacetoacetate hydrolase family protein [Bacteroidota bacterium]MBP7256765.1 fumarylacetoacetate hydrolase family protein [Chitinophagales bacterium]